MGKIIFQKQYYYKNNKVLFFSEFTDQTLSDCGQPNLIKSVDICLF